MPRFESGQVRYEPLPLFELLGVQIDYLTRGRSECGVLLYGHFLPPVELSFEEFDIAISLNNSLFALDIKEYMGGFEGVDAQTGCWNRPLNGQTYTRSMTSKTAPGKESPHYPRYKGRRAHIRSLDLFLNSNYPNHERLNRDHLCSNHACSNPRHVEPTSQQVNTGRASNRKSVGQVSINGSIYLSEPSPLALSEAESMPELFTHDDGLD